jgi:hypothetical protein
MTHFFRKGSFRFGCHIQPPRAQPILMLDIRSLEFKRQKADEHRRQAEEKKQQQEHFKDY